MDNNKKTDSKQEGEKQFSIQPIEEKADAKFAPFNSQPGPARSNEMPSEEGTKDDRQAKKAELNK